VFASSYLAFWIVPVPVLLLARLFGKKAILHHHDGRTRNHLAESPASVLVSGLATVVVAPSGFLGSICESHGLPTRAILNALPADSFHYRERCCLRPAFFHNRALEKVYNPECTLRAFQIIQQRHPEATLTMAHDGSLRNELEALALQLGLRNVTFLGAVSFERMKDLYHASDIFLSSSDHDNMPCSVLEAFASGLPVIATRAGGTEWILEHNRTGLLVECGDYEAMARCAFRLLEEPTLALRLSRAARRESQRYRLSEVMDKWVSLYEQLEQGPLNSKAKQTVRGEAERSVC
jgi:glycosyltransferase involved in cell wall biosynthesis